MSYSALKVREIVENAVSNTWSVPEFQRGFVWKATQVRDLAELLMARLPDWKCLDLGFQYSKEGCL